jgi:cytochrome c-type biogenesis protein CcsB
LSSLLLRIAAASYAVAAAGFVFYFARPKHPRIASLAQIALGIGFAIHAGAIGFGCREFGGLEFFTLRGGAIFFAWLLAAGYLLFQRVYRMPSVGAFVTPLVVMLLIPTLFGPLDLPAEVPAVVKSRWLPVHVSSSFAGLACFALAAGVALMYLLQEREVKGKHFGALFSRLPPLESLDRLNHRLVRIGFVVFTVALVTGAMFARRAWGQAWEWDQKQVFSLAAWLVYGAIIQLRRSGWHGRRNAYLTLIGFAIVFVSFVGIGFVSGSRHGGTYK